MNDRRRSLRDLLRNPALGTVLTGALVLSGCGNAATVSAAEQVPGLRTALTRVDSALAAKHYLTARRTLAELIVKTRRAEQDGSLSAERAAEIIGAAQALLALIPKPAAPAPTPTPTPRAQKPEPKKPEPKKKDEKREKADEDDGDDQEGDQPGPEASVTPSGSPTPTPTAEATPTEAPTPAAVSPVAASSAP